MARPDDPRSRPRFEQLRERLVQTMVGEIDQPHVVVCRCRASNRITLLGPYSDGFSAVVAAENERRSASATAESDSVVYLVAPIDAREVGA
ncbi:hypothetical protein [Aeromicrobium sp. Leaf350]|uniref:hypothetical protein n=1 Tax=Aeromicrobium sp. Leaf350 TaxID=2876565 RepID=UPI001E416BD8|nr:hypothetical protein [Aeromicrobium sp. Leaf350]